MSELIQLQTRSSKANVRPMSRKEDESIPTIRTENKTDFSSKTVEELIEDSLKVAIPSWPLQNTVAVNPFWFLRHKRFENALGELSPIVHSSLFMPIDYYRERFEKGDIIETALLEALNGMRSQWAELPESIEELLVLSRTDQSIMRRYQSFAENLQSDQYWQRVIVNDIGKYAAAYLDDQQALARFPWQSGSFWLGWLEGQKYDKAMAKSGIPTFEQSIDLIRRFDSQKAIAFMLEQMGVRTQAGRLVYLQRLVASTLGWASQFKYLEWQRSLGYQVSRQATTIEFLAVRLAYEFALFQFAEENYPAAAMMWQTTMNEVKGFEERKIQSLHLHYTWQLAFELSYQKRVANQIRWDQKASYERPTYQMIFCIDVRSEMIRRHIEKENRMVQTIGFAGFFGVPVDYHKLDEKHVGHRLPVLLSPAIKLKEHVKEPCDHKNKELCQIDHLVTSYFRNLRKGPLSSFLFVELFGVLSIEKTLRRTWGSLVSRIRGRKIPSKFDSDFSCPIAETLTADENETKQFVDRTAAILQHMGLTDHFGDLVLIVGHGSATTNNAFGSALDCGACGGHPGDINARFLTSLLNDAIIRAELKQRGIKIPSETWFVAAIHETVTDEIYLLDEEKIPKSYHPKLHALQDSLRRASVKTRQERVNALSNVLDSQADRRSHNWSEVRPEWGLTGNACFIVAPRSRTKGINLASRSFLHDYDWSRDKDFKTLELIMTAPMVVTNWINLQYYGSTVAPSTYGSGSKILHNLTNEVGVVEGNGGDLRVGLPFQSVHDGERFVHEPLRLSVFIEAPQEEIEKIIQTHETVKQLVDHEWLHILHLSSENAEISRRLPGGKYVSV